jgi:hypothetical protein
MTISKLVCSKLICERNLKIDYQQPCRDLPDKTRYRYWEIIKLCKNSGRTRTLYLLNRVEYLYQKYGDSWIWDIEGTRDDFWFAKEERDSAVWLRNFRKKPWFGKQPDLSETFYWKYQTYTLTRKNEGCKYWYEYFVSMNNLYGKNWIWEIVGYPLHDKEFVQELRANIIENWYNENPNDYGLGGTPVPLADRLVALTFSATNTGGTSTTTAGSTDLSRTNVITA